MAIGIPFDAALLQQIIKIADSSPHAEVGGIISGNSVIQLKNTCVAPEDGYIPNSEKYLKFLMSDRVDCFWHTHVNDRLTFSHYDLNAVHQGGSVPWLLYNQPFAAWEYKDPNYQIPYLERPWQHCWTDCYTLIRDFYRRELLIELPLPHHNGVDLPWLQSDWNEPIINLSKYFDKLEPGSQLQQYDLVLFNGLFNPAHSGILLNTRSGMSLLHHFYRKFSELTDRIEPENIHSIWRSKCTISQSNLLATWVADTGILTRSKQIN
jgi:proteasome lid subunit RPN8/RPN11